MSGRSFDDRPVSALPDALAHAATYDRFSGRLAFDPSTLQSPRLIDAQMRKALHRIEKGLSLASPRRPFGLEIEQDLETLVRAARERHCIGTDRALSDSVAQAERALASLRAWNESGTQDERSAANAPPRDALPETGLRAVERFFAERHSTRHFDVDRPVSEEDTDAAVSTALSSPSVCNRATGRVHLYRGQSRVDELFAVQQGNRGLEGVENIAIVTTSLPMFTGMEEFAQPWIDGGIFAMNLVWGFEQRGVGTCFLNWSMPHEASAELRRIADIPDEELIITMIAFGHPAEGLRVTASKKPPLDAVLTRHYCD
ncbi:nitroreductase family protein [Microbacterium paraoxydans]|uniref:nitroreductase family protein n=1 Tax=Microbacterium paraoxydans TaxID=199592 RepID=UPI00046A0347|nr:nitroreductase family protein [Microbacterium paraoxydans]